MSVLAKKKSSRKYEVNGKTYEYRYCYISLRYPSPEVQEVIRAAAKAAGISVNRWIVDVTTKAAKRQLG